MTGDDDRHVRAYRKGDIRGFQALYDKYERRVYGYLLRNCGSVDDAAELFQEVWLRVVSRIDQYETRGRFRQWLITCAHNVMVDHHRRARPQSSDTPREQAVEERPERLEIGERIEAALATLPFEQRQAFHLRQVFDCSLEDIATIQDCTREAAKSRLRYAYKKLRTELEDLTPS